VPALSLKWRVYWLESGDIEAALTEVGIKELRDGLSRYVETVRESGEEVIITDRGRPVAKLTPLEPWDERYRRLVAEGAITPPLEPDPRVQSPRVRLTGHGPSIADYVHEQRD
jgi:prevent-host-death family protein